MNIIIEVTDIDLSFVTYMAKTATEAFRQRFIKKNTGKDVLPLFSEPFFVQPTILFILSSEFMSSFRLRISALFCAADIAFSSFASAGSMVGLDYR